MALASASNAGLAEFRNSAASAFPAVEWRISDGFVDYPAAVAEMEARAAAVRAGEQPEQVWLLQHAPLYTAGTSARREDLLSPDRFPVYASGRGGQYTYHGPGQRIAYVMIDLDRRGRDIRCFVHDLEEWMIVALQQFNLRGERREGRVGIWVARGGGREDKVAAIGIRIRKWVSFHGIALNVDPDLSHFDGIVPCGITGSETSPYGVTSLVDLGLPVTLSDADLALRNAFEQVFGVATVAPNA